MPESVRLPLSVYASVALLVAPIALLPIGRLVELPLLALTLYGLYRLFRDGRQIAAWPELRLWTGLFALVWLPMLASAADALDTGVALEKTLVFLRLYFMGVGLIALLHDSRLPPAVPLTIGGLLALWVADGIVQVLAGANLLGQPLAYGFITGVFHPDQTLGHVLALLLPVFALFLDRLARRTHPLVWLLLIAYCAVILLTGKRAAWIMMGLGLALLAFHAWPRLTGTARAVAYSVVLLAGLLLGALVTMHPNFQQRVAETAQIAEGDREHFDLATSQRGAIWVTGLAMFKAHWVNGVGVRGFRHHYLEHAPEDDPWKNGSFEGVPTHPHWVGLEVAVEAGLPGLLGLAGLWGWILLRLWQLRAADPASTAWLAAFAIAVFPFNTGHAFYGSMMSSLAFFFLAMHLSTSRRP